MKPLSEHLAHPFEEGDIFRREGSRCVRINVKDSHNRPGSVFDGNHDLAVGA